MTPTEAALFIAWVVVGLLVVVGFFLVIGELDKLRRTTYTQWRTVMATLADLDAAIAKLDADVKALIASQPKPVDTQPEIDAVNAIDAEVLAATPPTP